MKKIRQRATMAKNQKRVALLTMVSRLGIRAAARMSSSWCRVRVRPPHTHRV